MINLKVVYCILKCNGTREKGGWGGREANKGEVRGGGEKVEGR